jgi:hypothetical protein
MANVSFMTSPWLQHILGVLWQTVAGVDIGRTDVVKLGDGMYSTWDATTKEIELRAGVGFRTSETSSDVAVTAGAGATTLKDYAIGTITSDAGVAIVEGQSLFIDVRIEAWRPGALDTCGYCDFTAHVVYHAAGSVILNDPTVEQVVSSSWEADLTADCSITGNTTFRVTATSGTTNVRCNVLLSHRAPRTRSAA